MPVNNSSEPRVLFHYTSLQSLALILSNRTIRFTRLDKLDDPQEQRTADVVNLAKMRFVSSWTSSFSESIPMWREYAGLEDGVRIELPVNPFGKYEWGPLDAKRVTGVAGVNVGAQGALVPFEELWNGEFFIFEMVTGGKLLHKVEYTNDRGRLFPTVLNGEEGGSFSAATALIGIAKAKVWSYQEEWRYAITILPVPFRKVIHDIEAVVKELEELAFDRCDVSLPAYFDLGLSDAAFKSMKIVASPLMTAGNRLILDSLIDKYAPGTMVAKSGLELA